MDLLTVFNLRENHNNVGVSKRDQIKFINICKEYGGYNDAEILMNAQRDVYADFNLDLK
jgi:hypothetical protein